MSEFSELLDEYYELRNIIEQIYEAVQAGRDIQFGDIVYTPKKPKTTNIRVDINEEELQKVLSSPEVKQSLDRISSKIRTEAVSTPGYIGIVHKIEKGHQ